MIKTSREFRVNESLHEVLPKDIVRVRYSVLGVSQSVFAELLRVAPQTVHAWEQGRREPSKMALRLIQLIEKHPEDFQKMLVPVGAEGEQPL